ncbi:MAG: hypothetical protein V1663_05720 [archaeon]
MKKEIDNDGRILYKFSHSIAKGGNAYIHKTLPGRIIENKQELRNALNAISREYNLIDPTIKIYDNIFFFFFHIPKSLAPVVLIESIAEKILHFSEWDSDYIFIGVYDLQDNFLRKDLERWGYDYEKG